MPADKKTSKKTPPQVMDVSKPGKTPPDPSSRPVIVGHKILTADPMMKPDQAAADNALPAGVTEGEKIQVARTAPKVIKPITITQHKDEADNPSSGAGADKASKSAETQKQPEQAASTPTITTQDNAESAAPPSAPTLQNNTSSKPKTQSKEPKPSEAAASSSESPGLAQSQTQEEPAAQPPSDKQEAEEKAPEPAPNETPQAPVSDQEATVGAVAGQMASKKEDAKKAEADKKQQEHLNQLVESKQYFLPIHAKHRRRTRWLLLLLVLATALGAYLAVDAQVFENDIALPYEFIEEQETSDSGNDTAAPDQEPASQRDASTESETETTATPAASARDSERTDDIDAIAQQLESYFAVNEQYPTLQQLNDEAFRSNNLQGLDREAYRDPEATGYELAAVTAESVYAYVALPNDCDNEANGSCTAFVLTTVLADGTTYAKESLN